MLNNLTGFPDIAVLEKWEGGRVSFKLLKSDENNLDKVHEMNGKISNHILHFG